MATESYKLIGSKVQGRSVGSLILDGQEIAVGQTVDLDDEKVQELRDRGFSLRKSSDDSGDTKSPDAPKGVEGQPATGAQHPAATSEQDNTVAARQQRSK